MFMITENWTYLVDYSDMPPDTPNPVRLQSR